MLARVVAGQRMREIDGRPALRRMAQIALQRRHKMRRRHTDRDCTVMARRTITSDPLMIEGAAQECRRGVAEVAIQ